MVRLLLSPAWNCEDASSCLIRNVYDRKSLASLWTLNISSVDYTFLACNFNLLSFDRINRLCLPKPWKTLPHWNSLLTFTCLVLYSLWSWGEQTSPIWTNWFNLHNYKVPVFVPNAVWNLSAFHSPSTWIFSPVTWLRGTNRNFTQRRFQKCASSRLTWARERNCLTTRSVCSDRKDNLWL